MKIIEYLRGRDGMNREIILARCILIISIIILVLTVLWDLEFIQSEILLYVLIGLLALLMFLIMQFQLNIRKSKFFIDSNSNNDCGKKIRKSVQVILVFSMIAEVFLLLLITHIISAARISCFVVIIVMIAAYCFFLLQWVISLANAVKENK